MPGISGFQQVLENMEAGVLDHTKDSQCIGCGECCSNYLPLSTSEIREIRHYVEKHHITECRHCAGPVINLVYDLTCPFLDTSKPKDRCRIYKHRPHICRAFICNQPPSKIRENKAEFIRTRRIVDMRATFFGGNDQ